LALISALAVAAPADAAFPGENGRIAFVSSGQIWTVNGDGSDPQQVTSPTSPAFDADPSWSPDGTRIAFSRGSSSTRDLYIVNADGSGATLLAINGQDPTWSPDGTEIAFASAPGFEPSIYRINVDGTNRRREMYIGVTFECCLNEPAWSPRGDPIAFGYVWTEPVCDPFDPGAPECDAVFDHYVGLRPLPSPDSELYNTITAGSDPDWAPTAAEIAHETARVRVDYYTWAGTDGDIAAVTADGSSSRAIVSGADVDRDPAWSPDGSSIVFQRGSAGLWVVPAAGGTPVQILNLGTQPDWQPVQRPHARPKGATPFRVSLVPAAKACTAPNRQHGPPLAFPSCSPVQPESPNLTISQGDARLRSVGSVRMDVIVGAPGGPDDSDVQVRFSLTNVMNSSDFSDYTGNLTASTGVRLTDRNAGQSSTTEDFTYSYAVPCAPTADTFLGSTCASNTSFDAIVPGSAPEGSRAIWRLGRLDVRDGQHNLFATQGVFVP
jgi:dipeptidyl aminopeptidase/acylaminoacyl peptidase